MSHIADPHHQLYANIVLLHDPRVPDQAKAISDKWLTAFQTSQEAWQACLRVIMEQVVHPATSDPIVVFMAAQILVTKIRTHWDQAGQNVHQQVRQAMQAAIVTATSPGSEGLVWATAAVLNQLCLGLALMGVLSGHSSWPTFVPDICQALAVDAPFTRVQALLKVLTTAAEEVPGLARRYEGVMASKGSHFLQHKGTVAALVLAALRERQGGGAAGGLEAAAWNCVGAWVGCQVSSDAPYWLGVSDLPALGLQGPLLEAFAWQEGQQPPDAKGGQGGGGESFSLATDVLTAVLDQSAGASRRVPVGSDPAEAQLLGEASFVVHAAAACLRHRAAICAHAAKFPVPSTEPRDPSHAVSKGVCDVAMAIAMNHQRLLWDPSDRPALKEQLGLTDGALGEQFVGLLVDLAGHPDQVTVAMSTAEFWYYAPTYLEGLPGGALAQLAARVALVLLRQCIVPMWVSEDGNGQWRLGPGARSSDPYVDPQELLEGLKEYRLSAQDGVGALAREWKQGGVALNAFYGACQAGDARSVEAALFCLAALAEAMWDDVNDTDSEVEDPGNMPGFRTAADFGPKDQPASAQQLWAQVVDSICTLGPEAPSFLVGTGCRLVCNASAALQRPASAPQRLRTVQFLASALLPGATRSRAAHELARLARQWAGTAALQFPGELPRWLEAVLATMATPGLLGALISDSKACCNVVIAVCQWAAVVPGADAGVLVGKVVHTFVVPLAEPLLKPETPPDQPGGVQMAPDVCHACEALRAAFRALEASPFLWVAVREVWTSAGQADAAVGMWQALAPWANCASLCPGLITPMCDMLMALVNSMGAGRYWVGVQNGPGKCGAATAGDGSLGLLWCCSELSGTLLEQGSRAGEWVVPLQLISVVVNALAAQAEGGGGADMLIRAAQLVSMVVMQLVAAAKSHTRPHPELVSAGFGLLRRCLQQTSPSPQPSSEVMMQTCTGANPECTLLQASADVAATYMVLQFQEADACRALLNFVTTLVQQPFLGVECIMAVLQGRDVALRMMLSLLQAVCGASSSSALRYHVDTLFILCHGPGLKPVKESMRGLLRNIIHTEGLLPPYLVPLVRDWAAAQVSSPTTKLLFKESTAQLYKHCLQWQRQAAAHRQTEALPP